MAKKIKNSGAFDGSEGNSGGGVDPRDLVNQKKTGAKPAKALGRSWREKVAAEEAAEVYYKSAAEIKAEKKSNEPKVAIDHDRNSKAVSRPIHVPKNTVSTDELGAPEFEKPKKRKLSFRKLVGLKRGGGNSKKV